MAAKSNSEPDTNQGKGQQMTDVWASAPDTPLIPYLTNEQRAILVNTRAELFVTGMEYDSNGKFGARFIATVIAPDSNAYHISFQTANGRSPRDQTNKWMWQQISQHKADRIPAQLCKRGNSYYLDKPGSETEVDDSATGIASSTADEKPDQIPF